MLPFLFRSVHENPHETLSDTTQRGCDISQKCSDCCCDCNEKRVKELISYLFQCSRMADADRLRATGSVKVEPRDSKSRANYPTPGI